jgi:enoyl-CoA hydratase/carnithine racemase
MADRSRLDVTEHDDYVTVRFDRPDKRNALDVELVTELLDVLDDLGAAGTEGILFTGRGPVTTAGADTDIVGGDDDAAKRDLVEGVNAVYEFLGDYRRPTVMAVKGAAIGAGFQLAVSCDFAVAGADAALSKPEIGYGVFSGYSTRMLAQTFGANVAREIALRGESISPERALEWGVVSEVVPSDDVEPTARDLLETLVGYDPTVYERTKNALQFDGAPGDFENYP